MKEREAADAVRLLNEYTAIDTSEDDELIAAIEKFSFELKLKKGE